MAKVTAVYLLSDVCIVVDLLTVTQGHKLTERIPGICNRIQDTLHNMD